jgi:cobalt-zinc-cadmium efflux system membrane fusion protein
MTTKSAALAAALIGTLAIAACGEKAALPAAQPAVRDPLAIEATPELLKRVTVDALGRAEVRDLLRVPGRVEVDEMRVARVGSPVTGRITDLEATVGQNVGRGQVLASLSSTELSGAQLGFLKSYSQRQLADRAASRAQQLYDNDVIGQAELQRRQAELVQADAELSASRDQLKVLGMSESAIAKLAANRTVTSASQIVSSIAGTVIERKVTQGQVVQPADTVFVVADLSSVWVIADIPEAAAGAVRVGHTIDVDIPAIPDRRIRGQLAQVAATVNPDTRTVRVRMDMPNQEREYKPGMLASVMIKGVPQDRRVVPVAAVVREDNRDYVFVQTGPAGFVLRQVTLGEEYEGNRPLVAGPRVYEAMCHDYPRLRWLSIRRSNGGPSIAIALQSVLAVAIAIAMIRFAGLEQLLDYIGLTLSLFAAMTVLGVMVMRWREPGLPRPYRTWGYPVTPLVFLGLEGWMISFTVWGKPLAAAYSVGTIAVGLLVYLLVRDRKK